MDVVDEWELEMDRMLDVFEQKSETSLRKINRRFEILGQPFNDEFRRYFLKRSTQRLDLSFTKIEMKRWKNNQMKTSQAVLERERQNRKNMPNCSASSGSKETTENARLAGNNDIRLTVVKSENVIEITDSDDEDDGIRSDGPNGMQNGNPVEKYASDKIASIGGRNVQTQLELGENKFPSNDNRGEGANGVAIAEDSNGQKNEAVESDGDESMVRSGEISKSSESIKVEINASLESEFKDEKENIPLVTFDPNVEAGQSTSKNDGFKRQPASSKTAANNRSKRYKCEHCDNSFKNNPDLRRHQRIHANGKLIGLKADANGLYHCNRCVRRFKNINHLSKHMKSHIDNQYLHYCARCLRPFELEASKDKHENRCEGRHFECHLCKVFTTTTQTHIHRHMRTHSGAKPFGCMMCNKFFQNKGGLKRHLNTVHS